MIWLNQIDYYWYEPIYLLNAIGIVPLMLISTWIQMIFFKWLVMGKLKAGTYKLFSIFYIRKWFVDQLIQCGNDVTNTFYATLYLLPCFRMLGIKVGQRAEISTASELSYDLVSIGSESFVADLTTICSPKIYNSEFTLEQTKIGDRAFIGNNSVLSSGITITDGTLIGVLSVPSINNEDLKLKNTSWFGSPAINLPRRDTKINFSDSERYNPPTKLYFQRLFIEYFRITLPLTTSIVILSFQITAFSNLLEAMGYLQAILLFPFLYFLSCIVMVFMMMILKKLLIGTYHPIEKPLWNNFVWRSELLTTYYENTVVPFLLENLRGTPFICVFLRILGCKIGKRVFIDTTDITEHDMITIGDDAIINDNATLQSHLFEDRVIKVGYVKIGSRCTVGSFSVILYNTEMKEDSELGDLSLLMRGEILPASTRWQVLPAQRIL